MEKLSNAIRSVMNRIRSGTIPAERANSLFWDDVRPTDTFLVSCPKSGTTWLTFLLIHLIYSDVDEDIHLRNTVEFIPDINRVFKTKKHIPRSEFAKWKRLKDPRLFRVHSAYDGRMQNVIYLMRDPRDMMVSQWHYLRGTVEGYCDSLRDFVASDGIAVSWEKSVSEWLIDKHQTRITTIRYEDLHSDPRVELRKLMVFLGLPPNDRLISEAIEKSDFERMKVVENQFGSVEKFRNGENFVRRGKVGSWVDEMDICSHERVIKKCGRLMKKFGYIA